METTLLLAKGLLLVLALILVVGLAPVTVKVSGSRTSVTAGLAASTLGIGCAAITGSRELESTCPTARNGTSVATDRHGLASAMSTSSHVASSLHAKTLGSWGGARARLVIRWGLVFRCRPAGRRCGELETRSGSLLLSKLGGLLSFGQSKGMTTLVATTRGASATTPVVVVLVLLTMSLLVEFGISRRSG